MARHEVDREDLLREATALVERAEWRTQDEDADPIVVGFRRDGSMSCFLGADPVYQFNASNCLRRAFRDGLLYKAERGRLIELRRHRTEHAVELLRRELTDDEQTAFVNEMNERLRRLGEQLDQGELRLAGQVPPDVPIADWVRSSLQMLLSEPVRVAMSPSVGQPD